MLMSIPFLIWISIFEFGPMFGWLMAFVQYDPNKGILGSQWVGLRYFKMFFQDPDIWLILRNTCLRTPVTASLRPPGTRRSTAPRQDRIRGT